MVGVFDKSSKVLCFGPFQYISHLECVVERGAQSFAALLAIGFKFGTDQLPSGSGASPGCSCSAANGGRVDCSSAERGSVCWLFPTERTGKVKLIFKGSSCRCCRIFISFLKVSILEQVFLL